MEKKDSTPTFKGSEFILTAVGNSKDILTVLLKSDESYTEEQVGNMVKNYLAKEVKA